MGLLVLSVILLRERGHGEGMGDYRGTLHQFLFPAVRLHRGVGAAPCFHLACDHFARGLFRPPSRPLSRPSSTPPRPMPFVRYLLHDGREVSHDDGHQFDPSFPIHLSHSNENGSQPSTSEVPADPSPLQFQLPYFIASGSSTVAPGGGAEILPYSQLQPAGDLSPNWLSRSFSPFSPIDP